MDLRTNMRRAFFRVDYKIYVRQSIGRFLYLYGVSFPSEFIVKSFIFGLDFGFLTLAATIISPQIYPSFQYNIIFLYKIYEYINQT